MHLNVVGMHNKSISFLDAVDGSLVDPWDVLRALADKSHSVRLEVDSMPLRVEIPPGEAKDMVERMTGERSVGSKVVAIRAYIEPRG